MSYHFTHCALRLGDNLAHLHFLRKLSAKYPSERFVHLAHEHYLPELEPLIFDTPRIALVPLRDSRSGRGSPFWPDSKPPEEFRSLNVWKNAGHFWATHPKRNHYAEFMIEFFDQVATGMHLESPIGAPDDLLFDYPLLKMKPGIFDPSPPWILVVNSPAQSGQARKASVAELDRLIGDLRARHGGALGRVVTTARPADPRAGGRCTADTGMSVTAIGHVSQHADLIVMISTGPSWPTFNVWNRDSVRRRIILIDEEKIGLSSNTVQCPTVAQAREVLEADGYL